MITLVKGRYYRCVDNGRVGKILRYVRKDACGLHLFVVEAVQDLEELRGKIAPAEFEDLVQSGRLQTLEAVLEAQLPPD